MPIYEYECTKCASIRTVQKITTNPSDSASPARAGETIDISVFVPTQSSGWYVTDYKRAAQRHRRRLRRLPQGTAATEAARRAKPQKLNLKHYQGNTQS